jgi:colanic acid/amylovoran biosynthesis glycosyltransferase
MKVVYVTSTLPYGKKEAFVIPEIAELERRGHEVLIVPAYPRGGVLHGDAEPLVERTVSRPLLSPEIAKLAVKEAVGAPRKALEALGRMFESRSASVLLRNLVVYPKSLWLAALARSWGADHIHAHWATVPATMVLVAGEVSGIPWSFTAHRFDIAEDNLLGLKVRKARFVRAISRRGAREISAIAGPDTPAPPVIHMGVPVPSGRTTPPRRPGGSPPGIVVAANLLEVKGHVYLLEAVRLLAGRGVHVRLDFAGDGPLREELEARTRALGIADRVTFLGLVGHQKLLHHLEAGRWDVLVLPSVVTGEGEQEGIPVALVEAMSYGVPVVSTETGGIPELFEGISEAPLVPQKDPEALAAAIERLIRCPDLRDRLVEAGRRKVEESFAVEATVAELIERFQRCKGLEVFTR